MVAASLGERARDILLTPEPAEKVELATATAEDWRHGRITEIGRVEPPDRPARPPQPELRRPGDMPKRRLGGLAGRVALLHALAHIELNAIDLAFDLICRFPYEDMPRRFYDDWVAVGGDEARHFAMLQNRLRELDASYGDLPAHDGLWQAAQDTAHDLAARLAVVPMILEARGLDVTPATVAGLRRYGDDDSADVLQQIAEEEIPHVRAGISWFEWLAHRRGREPIDYWQYLVNRHFKGVLKPPFNHVARARAGFTLDYYGEQSK